MTVSKCAYVETTLGLRSAMDIARTAPSLLLDGSPECLRLAQQISTLSPRTVITNGIDAAALLLRCSLHTVVLLAGVLHRPNRVVVPSGVVDLSNRAAVGFFGAAWFEPERGISDSDPQVAVAGAALACWSDQKVALVPASNTGTGAEHVVLSARQVDRYLEVGSPPGLDIDMLKTSAGELDLLGLMRSARSRPERIIR